MSELATIKAPTMTTASMVQAIIAAAQDPATDVEKMERLVALAERMQAKQSEMDFNTALTKAQDKMGRISADALNKQTNSRYATYAKLDRELRPLYIKNGLSLSFSTAGDAPPDHVRVVCVVAHKSGHSRTYQIDMPNDGKGAKGGDVMTKTHATGAATTYGMRYLLKMIFNVAIGEDDTDGNPPPEAPTDEQTQTFNRLHDQVSAAQGPEDFKRIKPEIERAKVRPSQRRNLESHFNARFKEITGSARR